jgi:CheY-like chemotaxis protein
VPQVLPGKPARLPCPRSTPEAERPPYFSLAVSNVQHLVTFAIMLVVGVTIAELMTRLKHQAHVSAYRDLDLGLPDRDGVEFIREMRAWSAKPILVLSARSDVACPFRQDRDAPPASAGSVGSRLRGAWPLRPRVHGAPATEAGGGSGAAAVSRHRDRGGIPLHALRGSFPAAHRAESAAAPTYAITTSR